MNRLKIINASRWFSREEGDWVVFTARANNLHPEATQPLLQCQKACHDQIKPFAWLAWNTKTQQIRMARDHFGQIPLFYYCVNQQFIFAESIKEIIELLPIKPDLTERVVIECFTHQLGDHVADYTTETFFKDIYRATPGCVTEFKNILSSASPIEYPYWELDPEGPDFVLKQESDYHEQFADLLKNTVKILTSPEENNHKKIGLELSGGLDSSSILIASQQAGLNYQLFTHAGGDAEGTCEYQSVQHLVKKFNLESQHQFVNAAEFDPINSLKEAANIFPGGSPYLFFPLANNIHQAVSKSGCDILVSGFGGDECISSHAGYGGFVSDMLRRKQYRRLWGDFKAQCQQNGKTSLVKQAASFCFLFQHANPVLYRIFSSYFDLRRLVAELLDREKIKDRVKKSPWMKSVRHRDYAYLQGHRKHTTRMRVEYSALAARALGFEYCYPFLSWPLVEFCFYLPPHMKRRNGQGRYLIWEYFSKHNPDFQPDKRKMSGSILPGTFAKVQEYLKTGQFAKYLEGNPYATYISDQKNFHIQTIEIVHVLMWKAYLDSA